MSLALQRRVLSLLALVVMASGCAQLRLPAIDPSGQSIFLPQSTSVVGPFGVPDAVFPSAPALPAAGTSNPPQPYGWSPASAAPYPQRQGLLSGLCRRGRGGNPLTSAVGGPPAAPPEPLMIVPEYGGLAQPPVPQPIGNRTFFVGSGSSRPGYDGSFTITPSRMVAPVGSTVILRAGICDEGGYLVMRQPIQWSLSQDSVGSIVDVDKTASKLWRHLFHKPPEKESGQYAVGLTSTVPQLLDRGTPDPNDDIWLMRGQTWMSLTSASEGATHVTSVAPAVNGWNERKKNATIYWVDGQWRIPTPVISGYGGHTLVTNVARCSTGQPVSGWLVRYEILGGTPAALDANGAQVIEVPTDSQGNGSVAIIPRDGGQGVTTVGVQVIRPGLTPSESRIKIGEGTTSITWTDQAGPGPSHPSNGGFSEPDTIPDRPLPPFEPQQPSTGGSPNISMDVRGPVVAEVGREVEYRFLVTNTGGIPIENVEVVNEVPVGLQYVQSSPQGGEFGDQIRWELGRLQPGQTSEVRVQYRADRAGVLQNCAGAIGDGATSDDCATTDVQGQSLSLTLEGNPTANVDDRVEYDVVIRNESNQPVNNVLLRAEFDAGLEHVLGAVVERPMGRLEPNETQRIPLDFIARQAGRQCVDVSASSRTGGLASDQICVDVGGTSNDGGLGGPLLPPLDNTPQPGPTLPPGAPSVRIQKTGPTSARVGDVIQFFITIQTGNVPATNFRLIDEFDLSLEAVEADTGPSGEPFQRDGNRLLWQIAYFPANKTETFRVNCKCIAPTERACNRAIVVSDNGLREEDETCLEIVEDRQFGSAIDGPQPLPGTPRTLGGEPSLGLNVRRSGPSLQGNGLIEYIVDVTNRANQDDHNVTLSVETPEGTRFHNSVNPPRIDTFRTSPDGRQVDFLPIASLRPGETMSFRVFVQQDRLDVGTFRAQAKSDLNPNVITRDDRA